MHKFTIELRGSDDDLTWLAEHLSKAPWRVDRIGDRYYLQFEGMDGLEDTGPVLKRAQEILGALKKSAKFMVRRDVEIEVQAITHERPDGTVNVVVLPAPASAVASTGDVIVRVSGHNKPSQLAIDAELMEAVASDPNVAEALHLFNCRPGDWAQLYKIIEIIRDDIGRDIPQEWASRSQIENVERHAQFPETAGVNSRHARPTWESPKNRINAGTAEEIVRKVLRHWMRSKAGIE